MEVIGRKIRTVICDKCNHIIKFNGLELIEKRLGSTVREILTCPVCNNNIYLYTVGEKTMYEFFETGRYSA